MKIRPNALLFCLGLLWCLAQFLNRLDYFTGSENILVAKSLVRTGEFRDPFYFRKTGPTAHVAPVYPAVVAVLLKTFGNASVSALFAVNACFIALAAALMPALSQLVFGQKGAGYAAGVMLIFASRLEPQWEASFVALILVAATLAILCQRRLAGLLCGIATLANPLSLPVLTLIAGAYGRRSRRSMMLVAGAVCMIVAPWMVRNWVVLGAPYFVRDNIGTELDISNNSRANPEAIKNWALWNQQPNTTPSETALVAGMGEPAYNRARLARALGWIRDHPRGFVQLCIGRVFHYWFPSVAEGWPAYLFWVVTLLAIPGVWCARNNRTAVILAASALLYSLTFAVIQTDLRYRYPTLWMMALPAGLALTHVLELARRRASTLPVGS